MTDESVGEYFNKNTDQYSPSESDWGSTLIQQSKHSIERKIFYINEHVPDKPTILDIGCGDGTFLKTINKYSDIERLVGIELASKMLPDNRSEINYCVGDGLSLPFQDNLFNVVHLDAVLHHVVSGTRSSSKQKAKNLLQEVRRVMTSDGHFIITERHQRARLLPDKLFSVGLFYGLKFGSEIFSPFHSEVHKNTPPISFYTESELRSLINKVGLQVTDCRRLTYPVENNILKMIHPESRRITLYGENIQ
jgi:ubiquinone/menaquinone biosynthesis C-methylase UbiE